jgi:glycosyltransferase involved in cell wall biosynthesis
MKIGIDAKWFYEGPPSGQVVVQNLLEHLIKANKDHKFYLFLNIKHKHRPFPFVDKNVQLVYIWSGINLISNVFVLKRKAIALKLDVVLFQNFPALTKKFHSTALIHDALYITYPEFYTYPERAYFFPLKYLAQKSKLIFTTSNSEKERLVANNFSDAEKIKVVYHGVDQLFKPMNEIDPNTLKKISDKYHLPKHYLLYVGRLNVRKNIKNLLLAIKQIENKEIPLIIVGKNDSKMFDLISFIDENELTKRVLQLGFVPDEDLPLIYAGATLFCFPSFAEGFGLPILEAMATGVPVLTSNTTALPEIASDAAVLVSPNNIQEIANGINKLLSDELYVSQITKKGLDRAREFTWEKSAKTILNYLVKIDN